MGRLKKKEVPFFNLVLNQIFPPWALIIPLDIASPRPVP